MLFGPWIPLTTPMKEGVNSVHACHANQAITRLPQGFTCSTPQNSSNMLPVSHVFQFTAHYTAPPPPFHFLFPLQNNFGFHSNVSCLRETFTWINLYFEERITGLAVLAEELVKGSVLSECLKSRACEPVNSGEKWKGKRNGLLFVQEHWQTNSSLLSINIVSLPQLLAARLIPSFPSISLHSWHGRHGDHS